MLDAPLKRASEVVRDTSVLVRAPRRVQPSVGAAEYLKTEKGAWQPDLAPMMIEPLNQFANREYNGIVFVGPARTGKTMGLILAGIVYAVKCAPGDIQVIGMSQDATRDFSKMDLDRMIRNSPEILAELSPRASDDNVFDKFMRSGTIIKLGWPAITQLSQKTIRYMMLTDYDRPKNRENVDGEGPLWELAAKRIETFMSRGKVLAESSPEAEYLDPTWKPATPHQAPPCTGILELYNRGTRARWYWPCPECGEPFQALPGLGNFLGLPSMKQLEQEVLTVDSLTLAERYGKIVCPHHGCVITQDRRPEMNAAGKWVHEGQKLGPSMSISGEKRHTKVASYWLGAAAAAFQRWDALLMKYFDALAKYMRTGTEESLKATVNMDQGAAYLPRVASARRSAEDLKMRLEEWPRAKIPPGVRFLTAAVDVQAHRFQVHVFGWGKGLESWLIERFAITSSRREERDTTASLEPGAYLEDWLLLVDLVIEKAYETVEGGVFLTPVITMVDSGGKAGVTGKAYAFWRHLKRHGKHWRCHLVKGSSSKNANVATRTYPDSQDRHDRKDGGRGDVPVWLINTLVLKDAVIGDLARDTVGPGYVHLPKWLEREEDAYFNEIIAETRTDKGWENLARLPNEAFDLHVYNRVACKILRADRINWDKPPDWIARYGRADAPPPVIEGEPQADAPAPTPAPAPAPQQQGPTVQQKMRQPGWVGKNTGWVKPGGWRK